MYWELKRSRHVPRPMPGKQAIREKGGSTKDYYQQQDTNRTVQKESIGKDRDDRVCGRIKDPVIIAEEDVMEGHKKILPVGGDQDSQNSGNGRGEDAGQF